MGECGCGEMNVHKAYTVGPYVLAVELYRGCNYCDTGLMVALHLFTPEEAAKYDIEVTGEFQPDEHGHAQIPFPVIGKDDLAKAAAEIESIERPGNSLLDFYDTLPDLLKDCGLKLLQRGMRIRLAETEGARQTKRR